MTTAAVSAAPAPSWDKAQRTALIAGAGGLLVLALGGLLDLDQLLRSYLLGYLVCLGISLGSLVALMIQHLTGGRWGLVMRRIFEGSARTVPLLAVLFLPIAFGMSRLYPWVPIVSGDREHTAVDHAHSDEEHEHEVQVIRDKQPYLNVPFFLVRAACYFAVWLTLVILLTRWSADQDRNGETHAPSRRFPMVSGPGLVLYGLTITFASIDWLMSLEPLWYSTIYPVLYGVSQVLSGFAFSVLVLALLTQYEPFASKLAPAHLRDIGNLLMAFLMLWAYMSISQLLLVWSGNIREEIPWYIRRLDGGWRFIAILLAVCHFAVPFLLLLSRRIKQNWRALGAVALGILVMRCLDLFWWIEPAFDRREGLISSTFWLFDIAAIVGIGGMWLWFFLRQLRQYPLLPLHDPYLSQLQEAPHGR